MRDSKTRVGKGNNVSLIRKSTLPWVPKEPLAFFPRVCVTHMPTRYTEVQGGDSGVGGVVREGHVIGHDPMSKCCPLLGLQSAQWCAKPSVRAAGPTKHKAT